MRRPEYVVVWDGRGAQPYLSCVRDAVRTHVPVASRPMEPRDIQGLVLRALRDATGPISAWGLSDVTGCEVKTCRVVMARAVQRGVAAAAGRRQETTRHYRQTWIAA